MTKIKTRKELIKAYIDFFKSKKHKQIANSSLIPENDPTVLFTTAGMHPLVPYLTGQKHPLGKRLVNNQKCIRTQDIDEVGDDFHLTFFEMLGNWSLGDYFKKQAIAYSFEFLTKILKIPKQKLTITCFKGDKDAPKDLEAAKIWQNLGIKTKQIKFLGKSENWWGPAGNTGPCGPDTEMFYAGAEIWNDVFMQYNKTKRLILVDGMYCLYNKNFKINKELLEFVNRLNSHYILTVNGFRDKGLSLIKKNSIGQDTNWEAFSLEKEGIKKDTPEYFKILLKTFGLVPEEIIYFDHDKKSVATARKLGIKSIVYKNNKQIKKFIEKNDYTFLPLKQKNIDTGMGVERTIAILTGKSSVYEIPCFLPIIKQIEKLSKKQYGKNKQDTRAMRIIADHIKASVFILAENIEPSNTEQGYVLRRLIRRAIRYGKTLMMQNNFTKQLAEIIISIYPDYKHLKQNKTKILEELEKEETNFKTTLELGLKKFKKLSSDKKISCKEAFLLYQSYGFPKEMIIEECKKSKIKFSEKDFDKEQSKHKKLSRTASAGKFKSGLADSSEETTKLHTATHLLNQALRIVLKKPDLHQRGSNITPERLRFDFNFDRKLTDKEIKKIEDLVNKKIKQKLSVKKQEMTLEQAKKLRVKGVFEHKYGKKVFVYSIANFSREICAGPHVKNTSELGKFKIIKEESSAKGVRRIKGVLI